jgi:hypothetical protein
MDKEGASRDQNHEEGPRPTNGSVRKCSLGGQKLHRAETDCREGESGMEPDDRRSVDERG